jgi:hypothetical protein
MEISLNIVRIVGFVNGILRDNFDRPGLRKDLELMTHREIHTAIRSDRFMLHFISSTPCEKLKSQLQTAAKPSVLLSWNDSCVMSLPWNHGGSSVSH